MSKFIVGTNLGIVLSTVGFTGITRMLDKGVDTVKTQTQEIAR